MNDALYTYAVVDAGCAPPDVGAILPGAALFALAEGKVAALASPVPRAWFEAGPQCRIDNPDWLAERAAAHHAVVAGLHDAVLPLAFGAIFSGEAPLRAWLRDGAPRFAAALGAVRGQSEWSVLLSEDAVAHAAWLRAHDTGLAALAARVEAAGPGTAFMLGRQLERALATARQQRRHDSTLALSRLLEGVSAHLRAGAPQQENAVAGFNLLLPGPAQPRLRAALEAAAEELDGTGLALALSGPWPPYAFAREAVAHG